MNSTFPDFEAHSKKTILWLRLFFIGLVVFAIPADILISYNVDSSSYLDVLSVQLTFGIINCISAPFYIIHYIDDRLHGLQPSMEDWPTLGGSILYTLLFSFIIAALCFSICKFYSWLHSTIREQRRFSETHYSPKSASCIALIPILFPVFHYQIFNDLLARQKEALEKNNLEAISLPNRILIAIPVLGVLTQVGWCIGIFGSKDLVAVRIISLILGIVLLVCYTKVIKAITTNLSKLNSLP